jgi:hypothetical protein
MQGGNQVVPSPALLRQQTQIQPQCHNPSSEALEKLNATSLGDTFVFDRGEFPAHVDASYADQYGDPQQPMGLAGSRYVGQALHYGHHAPHQAMLPANGAPPHEDSVRDMNPSDQSSFLDLGQGSTQPYGMRGAAPTPGGLMPGQQQFPAAPLMETDAASWMELFERKPAIIPQDHFGDLSVLRPQLMQMTQQHGGE